MSSSFTGERSLDEVHDISALGIPPFVGTSQRCHIPRESLAIYVELWKAQRVAFRIHICPEPRVARPSFVPPDIFIIATLNDPPRIPLDATNLVITFYETK